ARERGVTFFCDGVQAAGKWEINLANLGVDLFALSGHKIHGPKGIGALYIRRGTRVDSLIHGGGQESSRRGGTENVAGAVGLAKALELALAEDKTELTRLTDMLIDGVLATVPHSQLTGSRRHRTAGHASFVFDFIEGESLLYLLDAAGIAASTGSACSSKSLEPSHVLLAIGLPEERAHGSIRLSLSADTTEEDVAYILDVLPKAVQKLRDMSPLWGK
ncbi:MAG: aminotransferase class V-fold PLP-dependent enzyme, partial [Oscillospiraceae bacterium]|nr:aminotransferase class V-fold PLP-dependent enzyme [Oscillospiraceae bacterium]